MSKFRETASATLAKLAREDKAPWQGVTRGDGKPYDMPHNPGTGNEFNGTNAVILAAEMQARGSEDPRFMTGKRAEEAGAVVRKDAKPTLVEYWMFEKEYPVLDANNKPMFDQGGQPVTKLEKCRPEAFTVPVFHASDIDGLPPYQQKTVADSLKAGNAMLKKIGVEVVADQTDKSFYDKETGKVHTPSEDKYKSKESHLASVLFHAGEHVLAKMGVAENPNLRAQMFSSIVSSETKLEAPSEFLQLDNHADVIQGDYSAAFRAAANAKKAIVWMNDPERRLEIEEQTKENVRRMVGAVDLKISERLYVTASYEQKDDLKKDVPEAQFDPTLKSWWVPKDTDRSKLAKWDVIEKIKGEFKDAPPMKEFAAFIEEQGLDVGKDGPIMDGQWHKVPFKGQETGVGGQYRGFLDGTINGSVVNKSTGNNQSVSWAFSGEALNPNDIAEARQKWEERKVERIDDAVTQQRDAAATAAAQMRNDNTIDAHMDHCIPLKNEQIRGYNVKQSQKSGVLMIGARDIDGNLHSIQIDDGERQTFTKGSKRDGCFHTIDPKRNLGKGKSTIMVGENYFDSASIHEATGRPTVTVFEPGNMEPVVAALRERHKESEILIVAKNNDISLSHANKAAQAHGAEVLAITDGQDINEVRKIGGKESVRELVDSKIEEIRKSKEQTQEVQQSQAQGQGQEVDDGMAMGE